jgi:hypothetical protein
LARDRSDLFVGSEGTEAQVRVMRVLRGEQCVLGFKSEKPLFHKARF